MTAKYSIGFIHGFFTGKGSLPLRSDGDDMQLVLTKGDDFEAWRTDETLVKVFDGPVGEIPIRVKNRQKVHELVDAWLDGVEFDA